MLKWTRGRVLYRGVEERFGDGLGLVFREKNAV